MLHAGLDLSRRRVDVCLIGDEGEVVGEFASPCDQDGLRGLVQRVGLGVPVRGVIESMSGARFVHDSLEQLALTTYSDRLWREIGSELGPRAEVDRCGALWVAEDATQLDGHRRCSLAIVEARLGHSLPGVRATLGLARGDVCRRSPTSWA